MMMQRLEKRWNWHYVMRCFFIRIASVTSVYDTRELRLHPGMKWTGFFNDYEPVWLSRHVDSVRQCMPYELAAGFVLWNCSRLVKPFLQGRKPRLAQVAQMLSGSLISYS